MSNDIINKSKIQNSVLNKYLSRLENEYFEDINEKYSVYQKIFNSAYKDQITNLKESEYEQIFQLRLFQTVLGFQIDIGKESPRNIKFQPKSKEGFADGGIYLPNADDIDKKNIAVIEMKDSNTREINKINNQAFKYFKTDPNIKYTITCNFLRIRIYLDNTKDYIDFPIFNLSKDDFQLLYLFISYESILAGWPSKMKNETVHEEEKIEKRFYVDYSKFRDELFKNIVKNNTNISELILFNRTQKLLDRFIFIFFAEDKGLIYPNFIESVISYWKEEKKRFGEKSLYEDFNRYFILLDKGREKAHNTEAIFAFNGGLFKKDQVLENLKIDCDVLATNVQKLSSYDFTSQITVDILGHIFEHSLSEIEETEAKLKGEQIGKSKGKRKKDGVFYTPKYITKYIVNNTLGKLCSEKKSILELDQDFDLVKYQKSSGGVNKKGKKLFHTLELYKKWLLKLKIVDPACGSGAFLNEALSFLIKEHKDVDDLIAELTKTPLRIFDTEKIILENNIYGVDINEESVEIAKLSMWLRTACTDGRTAQKGRKLSNLSNNIKCGNSLIDDPSIAGDKAFDWEKEFPQVFTNGGFDVVIGNPPYVQINEFNDYFYKQYTTAPSGDLYSLFYQKSFDLLTNNGLLGFITPSSFMTNIGFVSLREELMKYKIISLVDLGANIFSSANVDTAIIIVQNEHVIKNVIKVGSQLDSLRDFEQEIFNKLSNKIFNIYLNVKGLELCNKLEKKCLKFNEYLLFARGVEFGFKSDKVVSEKIDENYVPLLCGGNISKQKIFFENKYIKFDIENIKIYKTKNIYENEKILVKRIGNNIIGSYDSTGYYNVCDVYNLQLKLNDNYRLKSISSIVNSKLINFFYDTKFKSVKKLFPKIPLQNLKLLPIPKYVDDIDIRLNLLSNEIIEKNILFIKQKKQFLKYLQSDLNIVDLPSKLKNWNEIEFKDFIKQLNLVIKKSDRPKFTKTEKIEWMEVFEAKKIEIQSLKAEIDKIDKEIDAMVYELYGLTDEEIAIIEND